MNASIQCNQQTEMYITSTGGTFGFDYILNVCQEIISQLKKKVSKQANKPISTELNSLFQQAETLPELRGTESLFNIYHILLNAAKQVRLDTFFHHQTPHKVRRILETARKNGQKLRLFYGDTQTGRDWLSEYDVIGTIGRSCGILHVPLLISDDESGGPALLDHCILRIIDCDSKEELYRHPKYQLPNLKISEIMPTSDDALAEYTHSVFDLTSGEESIYANCRSYGEACHLVAYLTGHSMTATY